MTGCDLYNKEDGTCKADGLICLRMQKNVADSGEVAEPVSVSELVRSLSFQSSRALNKKFSKLIAAATL